MIDNLRIRKKLIQLGITTVALVNGALSLGCDRVIEAKEEEIKEMATVLESEDVKDNEVSVTPNQTKAPVKTAPQSTVKSTPVKKAKSTSSDPYILTEDEAIEMGTYIYENYIKDYLTIESSIFQLTSLPYEKEDIINYVCLFNQKHPTVYLSRYSSCPSGDLACLSKLCIGISDANYFVSLRNNKNNLFPFSLFMKKGRPEKKVLEELEEEFKYISDNDVTDDEIYKYWGKVIKMAINADETFKDWESSDLLLFYHTVFSQYSYFAWCPQDFNGIRFWEISSKYVFENEQIVNLDLEDTFYSVSTTNKNKYSGLTNQEYDLYIRCFDRVMERYIKENVDGDNYVRRRIKNGN